MNRWQFLKEAFMRENIPVRYKKLAQQLGRISTLLCDIATTENIPAVMTEAMFFIEWIAPEVGLDWQLELLELQRLLAQWKYDWATIQPDHSRRQLLAEQATDWARRVAKISEVLQFTKEVA